MERLSLWAVLVRTARRSTVAVATIVGLLLVAMIISFQIFPDLARGDPRNATKYLFSECLWAFLVCMFAVYIRLRHSWSWLDFVGAASGAVGLAICLSVLTGSRAKELFVCDRENPLVTVVPVCVGWFAGGLMGSLLRWKWPGLAGHHSTPPPAPIPPAR
jgi:peptidoglycan/LPS O-acetylase OafA/YrhL